jgi:hypothetical protein
VELKQGNFKPEYKGQMELYLRWLAHNEQEPEENLPLGIILCASKNTEQIELLELDAAGIHVAEYLTVLPPPEVLRVKLHEAIEVARTRIQSREEENMPELPAKTAPECRTGLTFARRAKCHGWCSTCKRRCKNQSGFSKD